MQQETTKKACDEKSVDLIPAAPPLPMKVLFGNNWAIDTTNVRSDTDYNFATMIDFPFDEYNSWRENGKNYNKRGIGRGEPAPKYLFQKLNIFHIKYMATTLYNNGIFNHKSLIITREPNILIDNSIRLQLCSLINTISTRKEIMDYRYPRKMLIQKVVKENNDGRKNKWHINTCVCCYCWKTYYQKAWSNALQKNLLVDSCNNCGEKRIPMTKIIKKYLVKNNNNELDEMEFDLFKQRINDIMDPLLDSDKYWIPSVFVYNESNKEYEIKTRELNENLFYIDKCKKQLYQTLGNVFSKIVPMFEWVLDKKINGIYDKLNVVISIQDYQLKAGEIYCGKVHREGYKEENIVAAAVYYFDLTDDVIGDDIFEISAAFTGVWQHNKVPASVYYSMHQIRSVRHKFHIRQGNVLVFNNNNINHSLKQLQNISSTLVSHRKIVVFMLVNPESETPKIVSVPQVSLNPFNYNVDHYDDCKRLIDSIIFDIGFYNKPMEFPEVIKNVIIRYVIDNIVQRREIRNEVRFKRFLPPKRDDDQTLGLNAYATPWYGIAN